MKAWIRSLLPNAAVQYISRFRQRWIVSYAKQSYSQEGEDLILERFLEFRPTGFYVDVGAHHPMRFSNTYRLYRRGWRGLNIDANPGSMALFQKMRPKDINIEVAVSSISQELIYYRFNEPALNTFRKELALERTSKAHSIIEEVKILTVPLCQIIDQHIPTGTKINLLTVDVEGLDYDVLSSNDWGRYSPEFILVECLGASTLEQASSDPVARLLFSQHYSIVAKTMNTVLFRLTQGDSTSESM